jgi:hypothetical protein
VRRPKKLKEETETAEIWRPSDGLTVRRTSKARGGQLPLLVQTLDAKGVEKHLVPHGCIFQDFVPA